jgi:hypothetical protein
VLHQRELLLGELALAGDHQLVEHLSRVFVHEVAGVGLAEQVLQHGHRGSVAHPEVLAESVRPPASGERREPISGQLTCRLSARR